MTLTEDEYNNEFNQLKNISIVDIVKDIKNSIDAIVAFKVEDLMDEYKSKKNENENAATDYEKQYPMFQIGSKMTIAPSNIIFTYASKCNMYI